MNIARMVHYKELPIDYHKQSQKVGKKVAVLFK